MLFQQKDLEEMMHMAIVNNRVNFVHLLLKNVKNGVSLREFLTDDELLQLYKKVETLFNVISLFMLHIWFRWHMKFI